MPIQYIIPIIAMVGCVIAFLIGRFHKLMMMTIKKCRVKD